MKKKGLIMEGGAMRGMFTAGVIDVLMENGIEFDGALGVSAGAAFGVNYKSKQIGQVIRYHGVNDNTSFLHLRKRCSLCGMRHIVRIRTRCDQQHGFEENESCIIDSLLFLWYNI